MRASAVWRVSAAGVFHWSASETPPAVTLERVEVVELMGVLN